MSNNGPVAAKAAPKKKKASYTPQFKLERAIEALCAKNISDLARKYNLS